MNENVIGPWTKLEVRPEIAWKNWYWYAEENDTLYVSPDMEQRGMRFLMDEVNGIPPRDNLKRQERKK